jgi:excisionase family DNA binding protein
MKLLNETQVAERYGITKPCLRRWRQERRGLPWISVGRLVRYSEDALEEFVKQNTQHVRQEIQVDEGTE